jgi:hypothetical protein
MRFPRSRLARTYDFFIRKWILTTILVTLSGHWFLLLRVYGVDLNLVDQQGRLTTLGHTATWPIFIGSLLFALIKAVGDTWNDKAQRNAQSILGSLLQSVNTTTATKLKRFADYLAVKQPGQEVHAFADITQPKTQIISVLDNMGFTLAQIFGLERDKVGLSIIYKTDRNGEWKWLYAINTDDDLTLQELLGNPRTTVNQIMNDTVDTIFYPDKTTGISEGRYVPGRKDERHGNCGSVLCRDISIGHNPHRVRAILSITTYGERLCDPGDKGSIAKINNLIVDTFSTRLKLELSLLYIKEVLTPKCLACPS